jgi:hypothetical protein
MLRTITGSIFVLIACCGPELALGAAKSGRCENSTNIRTRCAIELGAYCNPQTGAWRLGGGTIKGGQRLQDCMDRKRAEPRR